MRKVTLLRALFRRNLQTVGRARKGENIKSTHTPGEAGTVWTKQKRKQSGPLGPREKGKATPLKGNLVYRKRVEPFVSRAQIVLTRVASLENSIYWRAFVMKIVMVLAFFSCLLFVRLAVYKLSKVCV